MMGTVIAPVTDALAEVDSSAPIQCENVWKYDVSTQKGERCQEPADLRVLFSCVAQHAVTEHLCADCYALSVGQCSEYAMCSTCDMYTWVVIAEPIR